MNAPEILRAVELKMFSFWSPLLNSSPELYVDDKIPKKIQEKTGAIQQFEIKMTLNREQWGNLCAYLIPHGNHFYGIANAVKLLGADGAEQWKQRVHSFQVLKVTNREARASGLEYPVIESTPYPPTQDKD